MNLSFQGSLSACFSFPASDYRESLNAEIAFLLFITVQILPILHGSESVDRICQHHHRLQLQSIGRDAILLNQQVFNNLCTFQT